MKKRLCMLKLVGTLFNATVLVGFQMPIRQWYHASTTTKLSMLKSKISLQKKTMEPKVIQVKISNIFGLCLVII